MESNSNENRNTNPFMNRPGIILLRKPQETPVNTEQVVKHQENACVTSPTTANIPQQLQTQGMLPAENPNDQLPIDDFILQLLSSPQKRLFALKLDLELERFLKQPEMNKLEFPPMDSYQRLVVHRVAQYFKLDHAVIGPNINNKRTVVLFKKPNSQIPTLRFSDLIEQEDQPKNVKIQILTRSQQENKPVAVNKPVLLTRKPSENLSLASKSLEQREEDYAKARARIFNGFESNNNHPPSDCDLEPSTSNTSNSPSSPSNSPDSHDSHTENHSNSSTSPTPPPNEHHSPHKPDLKSPPNNSPVPSPTGSFNKRPFLDEPPAQPENTLNLKHSKENQSETIENSQQQQPFNNQSPNPSPVHSPTGDRVTKNFKNQLKLSGSDSHDIFNRNSNNPSNPSNPSNSNFWKRDFEDQISPDPSNFSTWHPPLSSAFTPNNFQPSQISRNVPSHREEEYSHRSYSDSSIIRPSTFIPSDPLHGNINYPGPPPIRWPGAIPDSTPHWGVPTFPPGPRSDFPPPGPYSPGSKLPPPHEHFPPPGPRDPFNNFNPPPPSHDRNFFYPPQQRNNDFPPPPVYVYPSTPWSNPTQPRYAHDYERPKPKSTQLYDPNAPQDNFNIHPHSPLPISPTFIHPPFEPQYNRPINEPIPLGRSAPRFPKHPSLLYDYTQPAFNVPPAATPTSPTSPAPATFNHILELKNLPDNISLQDGRLETLKKAGATLKVLEDKNIVLAIFKNAAAAKSALETITCDLFELIVYKTK